MNIKNRLLIIIFLLNSLVVQGAMTDAWNTLKISQGNVSKYPTIIKALVDEGLYFASIPYIKEYLLRKRAGGGKKVDLLIDRVVSQVGIKQFEVLPSKILNSTNAPTLQYVMAKKYFRKGQYKRALKKLNATIPANHPAKPFALFLEGSIYSITKNYNNSVAAYRECVAKSEHGISRTDRDSRKKQLEINRDYCIAGIARTHFAARKFEKANLAYLDLSKSSYIWPEILFEEAWNSFYMRDYNRTLGKLVTYKAPVLNFIFNPEVEVLRALTFMELCLWDDSKKVVNNFYKKYGSQAQSIKKFLAKHRKDYKYYYLLAKSRAQGKVRGNALLNQLLKTIIKDPAYIELYDSFQTGREELEIVRNLKQKYFKKILSTNLKESLLLQRNLVGAYVRKQLDIFSHQLEKSYEGMSYIKLEVLNRRKKSLYDPSYKVGRTRGDIKNLVRNEKQYFWTFNGEFWADELGDYVFSLKSECN